MHLLLSCSLWLLYGLKKPDFTITLVNTVGVSLQLFYTFVYHIYVENKVCTYELRMYAYILLPQARLGATHFCPRQD